MAWDWSDTFRGLIAAAIGWMSTRAIKKVKPSFRQLIKFLRVAKKAEEVHLATLILKSSLDALYHIDRDPIFITNPKGELTYCNPAWVKLTGLGEHEAKGFGYSMAIHPDDREKWIKTRDDMINHPVPFFGEVRFKNLITGEEINTICRTELIYNGTELIKTLGRLYIVK